jgi:PPOX class probable F420-dependent enzyme
MSLSDETYVLFTTFRKDGRAVPTPVWFVDLGDGTYGFTIEATSGKAKRLAHTSRVTVQPCGVRGKIKPGTEPVEGQARVVTGDEAARVVAAVKAKHRVMVALMDATATVKGWFTKGDPEPDAAVIVTFP